MTVSAKLAKQIAGTCCYSGCSDPALDGSDFCDPHDAHERARDADKKRRRRQRLAEAGLCIVAGCGQKVPRRRRPDGSIMRQECKECRKAHRQRTRDARDRACVPGDSRAVPVSPSDRTTRNVEGDGYARERYHGQGKRGQQKRWQLDVQDLDEAIERIRAAKRGILAARDGELAGVPRIQLAEIRNEGLSHASLSKRFLEEVMRRNHYREIADSDDTDDT